MVDWSKSKTTITSSSRKDSNKRIEFHAATKPNTSFKTLLSINNNNSTSTHGFQTLKNSQEGTHANKNRSEEHEAFKSTNTGLYCPTVITKNTPWKSILRGGSGLYNHGNTCFLNSVLQCLLYTPPLSQILLDASLSNLILKPLPQRSIIRYYQKIVSDVWSSSGRPVSPRILVQNIRQVGRQFRAMRQEDAHEFLRQLLDSMHEEILKAAGVKSNHPEKLHETTLICRIFGGYLRNELKCPDCSYKSHTYNHFQDLSLDVVGKINSVTDALTAFRKSEKLDAGNEWLCDKCKKRVRASKQLTVSSSPAVLVLHLKRFSYGHGQGKINKGVGYEEELKLSCSDGDRQKEVKYSLFGVIVHSGGSVHSGHYVAYVKSPSNQWLLMDDSSVSNVSLRTVLSQQAYVLFYLRHSDPLPLEQSVTASPALSLSKSPLVVSSSRVEPSADDLPDKFRNGSLVAGDALKKPTESAQKDLDREQAELSTNGHTIQDGSTKPDRPHIPSANDGSATGIGDGDTSAGVDDADLGEVLSKVDQHLHYHKEPSSIAVATSSSSTTNGTDGTGERAFLPTRQSSENPEVSSTVCEVGSPSAGLKEEDLDRALDEALGRYLEPRQHRLKRIFGWQLAPHRFVPKTERLFRWDRASSRYQRAVLRNERISGPNLDLTADKSVANGTDMVLVHGIEEEMKPTSKNQSKETSMTGSAALLSLPVKQELKLNGNIGDDHIAVKTSNGDSNHAAITKVNGFPRDNHIIPPNNAQPLAQSSSEDVAKLLLQNGKRVREYRMESWDSVDESTQGAVENMRKNQFKKEKMVLDKRKLSEWDRALDIGHVKKIKIRVDDAERYRLLDKTQESPFQKVLDDRKMNGNRHDRYSAAKKFNRNPKSNKNIKNQRNLKFGSNVKRF